VRSFLNAAYRKCILDCYNIHSYSNLTNNNSTTNVAIGIVLLYKMSYAALRNEPRFHIRLLSYCWWL